MRDHFQLWGYGEGSFEHEIAHGHMGRQATNRALRKHRIALGVLELGRNVCFKKDAAPAPAPDPAIGQAAAQNVQLGKDWLDFSKQQFEAGNIRQDQYDQLIKGVVGQQLATQDQANKWALEDRTKAGALGDKYDQWATQDRATQAADKARYDAWAAEDRNSQLTDKQKFDKWALEDRQLGRDTKSEYDKFATDATAQADKYAQTAENQGHFWAGKALEQGDQYGAKFDALAGDLGTRGDQQFAFSDEQRARYNNTFAPVEDRFAKDAMEWDSEGRQTSEAAKARADVLSNAASVQRASQRSMAAMGINPNSGRFSGVQRSGDVSTALAAAGAENASRDMVRQQGIQLRGQAIDVGSRVLDNSETAAGLGLQSRGQQGAAVQAGAGVRSNSIGTGMQSEGNGLTTAANIRANGLSTAMQAKTGGLAATGVGNTAAAMGAGASGNAYQSASLGATNPYGAAQLGAGQQGQGYAGLGLGLNAGSSAIGSMGAGNSNFYANGGVMGAGYNGAIGANNSAGSMLNTQYGNQLNAWGMQQQASAQSSAGFGSMLGTIAGAGITAY